MHMATGNDTGLPLIRRMAKLQWNVRAWLTVPMVTLLLACGAARTAEWVYIGDVKEGNKWYVDVSSIRISGPIRHALLKSVDLPHTIKGPSPLEKEWESYYESLYKYNCDEGSAKLESMTVHYENGAMWKLTQETIDKHSWSQVIPDTVGGKIMKVVCVWKPK
jgi:hypothetical protein